MTERDFWETIELLDWDAAGDDEAVLEPALQALAALDEGSIFRFHDLLAEKLHALDTRAHARACYDGDDSFSGDDFLYARCVVVANGRDFYAAVLADPTQMPQGMEFEALLSLPDSAYERKTGKAYEHASPVSYESFQNADGWAPASAR